jgi:glutathione peroxidase-family protein
MYDLTMTSIGGDPVSLDGYRNQVCLIVNVASF